MIGNIILAALVFTWFYCIGYLAFRTIEKHFTFHSKQK